MRHTCNCCSNRVSFYKDGYTDFRGVFDYASLSVDKLVTHPFRSFSNCNDRYITCMIEDGGALHHSLLD